MTTGEFIPTKKYDMTWCCEFVEHVEDQYLHNFMKTFNMFDVVAMTHGVPGQPGYHHVNCQESEYWIKLLSDYGFEYLESTSLSLRDSIPDYYPGDVFDGTPPNLQFGGHVKNTLMVFKKR